MAIADIPLWQLQADRDESVQDAGVCRLALQFGVTEYGGGSVQQRLDRNLEIIDMIDRELARRQREAQNG